jgi:hypothetical protein
MAEQVSGLRVQNSGPRFQEVPMSSRAKESLLRTAALVFASWVVVLASCSEGWAALAVPDSVWYGRVRVNGAPPPVGSVLSIRLVNGTVLASYTFGVDPVNGPGYVMHVPMLEWTADTSANASIAFNGDAASFYLGDRKVHDAALHAGVISRLDLGLKIDTSGSGAGGEIEVTSGGTILAGAGSGDNGKTDNAAQDGDAQNDENGRGLLGLASGFGVLGGTEDTVTVLGATPTSIDGNLCSSRAFLGHDAFIGGDLVLTSSSGEALTVDGDVEVAGRIFTGGGEIVAPGGSTPATGASCGAAGDATAAIDRCRQAVRDAVHAAGVAAANTATSELGDHLVLDRGSTLTLPGMVVGALNVIDLEYLRLQRDATLLVPGNEATTLILNVRRALSVGAGARIVAQGIPPERILINVVGEGNRVRLRQGSEISGTLLAVERNVLVGSNSLIEGAVIAGVRGLHFGPGTVVVHHGFTASLAN